MSAIAFNLPGIGPTVDEVMAAERARRRGFIAESADHDPDGLRPYQRECVDAILSTRAAGTRRQMVVIATGGGKTRIASALLRGQKGRGLFLAHTDELVTQARNAIQALTGEDVGTEKAESRSAGERLIVGSIQSMSQRHRLSRFTADGFEWVLVDECFPAGTLVDGRKIESIRVGESVKSVDHNTGLIATRRVVRLFKKHAPVVMTLTYGETEVRCTPNHPIFVKGRGYVEASKIKRGDLLCVWGDHDETDSEREKAAKDVRKSGVQAQDLIGVFGQDKSHPCVGSNENEQSDAPRRQLRTNEGHIGPNRSQTTSEGRERNGRDPGGEGDSECVRMAPQRSCQDGDGEKFGVPHLLQGGRRASNGKDSDRGGRNEPWPTVQEDPRQEERGFLTWVRVDRVESLEPPGPGGTAVYNIEVEGTHTYFANGILVHNCHRSNAPSYHTVMDHFTGATIVGFTATPHRGDKKPLLGTVFDVEVFRRGIGELIEMGFLVEPLFARVQIEDINLTLVKTTKKDGETEFKDDDLDRVMSTKGALYGVRDGLLREAGERRTIVFSGPTVATSQLLTDAINEGRPGSARCIYGDMPTHEREAVLRDHKSGAFQFLVGVSVLAEGYDDPEVACVAIARPTKSWTRYTQCAGRGLRVAPGKKDCLIIDFTGVTEVHDLRSGPELLRGKYSDREVQIAKEILAKAEDLGGKSALVLAREQLREEAEIAKKAAEAAQKRELARIARHSQVRSNTKLTVKYRKWEQGNRNPFAVLKNLARPTGAGDSETMASPSAVRAMIKLGYKEPPVLGWTKAEADAVIGDEARRKANGIASGAQIRNLTALGVQNMDKCPRRLASALLMPVIERKKKGGAWSFLPGEKDRIIAEFVKGRRIVVSPPSNQSADIYGA